MHLKQLGVPIETKYSTRKKAYRVHLDFVGEIWVDGDASTDCVEGWDQYFIIMVAR
jgi:hypothetical protein